MTEADELRKRLNEKGPWYAGFIYSPSEKTIVKAFSTNAPLRFLDDVLDHRLREGQSTDCIVVYCEEFLYGQEKANERQKELSLLSDHEKRALINKSNPNFKNILS